MKTKQIMRIAIGVFCCLILLNIIPIANAQTDHFTNSVIIIIGKCNTVATPALWLFGFKFLISKKVIIQANGEEGEKINVLVLPPQIGFYFGHKNMLIDLERATGLFFWGKKSLLLQQSSQRILAICKARDIFLTYDEYQIK